VIIDRIRVRPDIALGWPNRSRPRSRSATALRMSLARRPAAAPIVFSDKFACNECGYSLRELEPRLFSFNNPIGACPDCDGLGVRRRFFDAERIVRHPNLSLAGGAIRGWDRRNPYYFQMIQSLAAHYGFDIEKPFEDCRRRSADPARRQRRRDDHVPLRERARQPVPDWRHLRRRHPEHAAPLAGDRIERGARGARQVPEHPALPECGGTRLNEAARNVFVEAARCRDQRARRRRRARFFET
jgi:excinuclease ABC subunit A